MNDVKLTPEEQNIFDTFYQRRVDEARAGGSDEEELEVALDILAAVVNDGLTPTADGGVSYVRRGAMDWTDPATMMAAQSAVSGKNGRSPGKQGGKNEMLQGILLMFLALGVGGYFLFFSGDTGEDDPMATEMATAATAEEAEAVNGLTPTPLPTLESELLADIVDSSGVRTELVVPRTLEVKGVSFVVQPVQIRAGDWAIPFEERAVSWVYGTVINYVMGIEATGSNKKLLASLGAGDELLLRMSTGQIYRFAYADAVRVAPQASEIFRQNRPGLTLVLLSDTEQETRVVVRANYIPESELGLTEPYQEIKASLGKTVMLDDSVRVTCLGSRVLTNTGAPPGYIYQAVTYQVENLKDLPLASGPFKNHIEVDGMTYPIVSVPHEINPEPAMPEMLEAGQAFSTTAIYAVPETALPKGLAWEFSPGPSGMKARVLLPPYSGRLTPVVEVKEAGLDEGELVVTVVISSALRSIEVTAADLQVKGGALSPVGNHFPWRIEGGSAGEFNLLLSPAGDGRTIVTFLDQGFELTYPIHE